MTKEYDPREDPTASAGEKNYYDFFELCLDAGHPQVGLRALRLNEKVLPLYMINKFKPLLEAKIKEGDIESE